MIATPKKIHINTITDYHKLAGLPTPGHPLLSVIKFEDLKLKPDNQIISMIHNFYSIVLKRDNNNTCRYGQKQEITLHQGGLHFMSPKQVLTMVVHSQEYTPIGWLLLIHPDFLWNTAIAKKIKQYEFFSYEVNESLALSVDEETTVVNMIKNINQEVADGIDLHSKDVIIAQIELLLAYSERIYKRLFTSEKKNEHRILDQLEILIVKYFKSNDLIKNGIPTIQYIADQLHISPNYLSRLLQSITGQSTKNYLHDKLIELAKEKLSTTELSVSEIAYEIGFKTPQSFSKLFKNKTKLTPLEFRKSFN